MIRFATLLMAGLAVFHLCGAIVLAYHLLIGRSAVLLVFGISRSSHEGFAEWGQSAFIVMVGHLLLAFILRCLVEGIWKEKKWAWGLALVLCGLLIFVRVITMDGWMPHVQALYWNYVNYCGFIVFALLYSAPDILKPKATS